MYEGDSQRRKYAIRKKTFNINNVILARNGNQKPLVSKIIWCRDEDILCRVAFRNRHKVAWLVLDGGSTREGARGKGQGHCDVQRSVTR